MRSCAHGKHAALGNNSDKIGNVPSEVWQMHSDCPEEVEIAISPSSHLRSDMVALHTLAQVSGEDPLTGIAESSTWLGQDALKVQAMGSTKKLPALGHASKPAEQLEHVFVPFVEPGGGAPE
jgi:hypothetical protein